ncbi:hypothetical protein B5P19_00065 [Clavibacter sepedonicus]|uniref:Membrane protein n=1 Tax=Clavibacter sepedonicus TaxID=31964 RepID=B0RFU7_CLASE|nr:hypothetical protein B5P19_00065 [Clavibacter sepedonicus]OQJ55551.1 hypothetical protein B5P20_13755 [Clavibacter sepedonicus]CAQ01084.1 putative membrane protein [Clavibacter sepedonicus]
MVVGLLARGVVDESFVRDFWTGPPAAGIFALIGAGLAYGAATVAARVSRRSAERQEWWDRAKWALDLVMSSDEADREVGLAAIEVLVAEATTTEAEMIDAVTSSSRLDEERRSSAVSASGVHPPEVDTIPTRVDNG